MKIAIIAYSCRQGGGLIQTIHLLKALASVAQDDEFLLICPEGCGFEKIDLPAGSRLHVYSDPHTLWPRLKFEYITLPRIVRQYQPDIIFGPGNSGVFRPSAPQVLYIRQAYLFYDKKHFPNMPLRSYLRLLLLKHQMNAYVKRSSWIFCQTSVVKERFSEKYNFPKDRVTVSGFPVPKEISISNDFEIPAVFDKTGDNFYVLLLTRHMPHRNPGVLIPLCKRYAAQLRERNIRFIITLDHQEGGPSKEFLQDVAKGGFEDLITNVGRLGRQDIVPHLKSSQMLWHPTLLECMSTAYIEAMTLEVPIFTSNMDFARYVCDDAAVYYDPWDIDDIFKQLMVMRNKPELRQQLIDAGKEQLKKREKFPGNWDEVAMKLLDRFRNIVKGNIKHH